GKPEAERLYICTGGGPGIMEAANRGAHDEGALNVGLNIALPHEQKGNPYITPSLCFKFHYFALRKMHFMMRAKALVAFPGGFGTLD
ncbi:LOG family protein, partial [Acinetobacter baumannii]